MSRVARDMMEQTVPARGSQPSVLIHTVSWDGDVGTPSGWATMPWPLPAARARVSGVRLVMLLRPLRQALGNVLTYVDRVQPEYRRYGFGLLAYLHTGESNGYEFFKVCVRE